METKVCEKRLENKNFNFFSIVFVVVDVDVVVDFWSGVSSIKAINSKYWLAARNETNRAKVDVPKVYCGAHFKLDTILLNHKFSISQLSVVVCIINSICVYVCVNRDKRTYGENTKKNKNKWTEQKKKIIKWKSENERWIKMYKIDVHSHTFDFERKCASE